MGSKKRNETKTIREEKSVGKHARALLEYEQQDPDRWGHSGFLELYAESNKKAETEKKSPKSQVRGKLYADEETVRKKKHKSRKKKRRRQEDDILTISDDSISISSDTDNDEIND